MDYIEGIMNSIASPRKYVKSMKPCTVHTQKNSTHLINTCDLNPGGPRAITKSFRHSTHYSTGNENDIKTKKQGK